MIIRVGFSRPKHRFFPIFSWLIRTVQKTEYSHTYVSWVSSKSCIPIVYEASGTMVHFVSRRLFDEHVETIHEYELDITDEHYKELIKFCLINAGVSYGIRQVFGMVLVKLFNLKKNPFSDGKKSQVCSELVGYILNDALSANLTLDLDIAGPKEIKDFLDTYPLAKKVK